MKKVINAIVPVLVIIVACVLLYVGIRWIFSVYLNHKISNQRAVISKQIELQGDISSKVSDTFLDYEGAIYEYEDKPNDKNLVKLLITTTKLNNLLFKASHIYGLNVKRWMDRFNVWQYQFLKSILSKKRVTKIFKSNSHFNVLFYEDIINNKITSAEDKYRLNTYNDLLYPTSYSSAPSALTDKIDNIYRNKAKALIPQAVEDFKQKTRRDSIMACTDPDDEKLTPKSVADNIVFLEYRSRFCPFSASTKTDELCYKYTHLPLVNKSVLVFCKIVKKRQVESIKKAKEKYRKLSFGQYFTKHVIPLIPTYKKQLIARVTSHNFNDVYDACESRMQPVVGYRDPEVDAQTAVYVLYGNTICKSFFKNDDDDYAKHQMLTNKLIQKESNKHGK